MLFICKVAIINFVILKPQMIYVALELVMEDF